MVVGTWTYTRSSMSLAMFKGSKIELQASLAYPKKKRRLCMLAWSRPSSCVYHPCHTHRHLRENIEHSEKRMECRRGLGRWELRVCITPPLLWRWWALLTQAAQWSICWDMKGSMGGCFWLNFINWWDLGWVIRSLCSSAQLCKLPSDHFCQDDQALKD